MLIIKDKHRQSAKQAFYKASFNENSSTSLLGLGHADFLSKKNHGSCKEEIALNKIIALQEFDNLVRHPTTFMAVNAIKEYGSYIVNIIDFCLNSSNTIELLPSKQNVFEALNFILSKNGIGSNSLSYKTFLEIIKNSGPGIEIKLKLSDKVLEPVLVRSSTSFFLFTILSSNNEKNLTDASVVCFEGNFDKLFRLHKLIVWSVENKKPLVLVGSGFSEEIIKTVNANNLSGKTNIVLLSTGVKDELNNIFSQDDFALLSGTKIIRELPEEFKVQECGLLNAISIQYPGSVFVKSTEENFKATVDTINRDLKQASDMFAEKIFKNRLARICNEKLTVQIPSMAILNGSHLQDEISCILSLWSSLLSQKYVCLEEEAAYNLGIDFLPVQLTKNAVEFINTIHGMIENTAAVI
jgi:hypothetical protein